MGRRRRDFGQILKIKGKWTVRWPERGKVRQRSLGGSKDLAVRFLAKKHTELAEQTALGHLPVDPIRFEVLFDQYAELFTGEKEPATVIREERYMRSKMLPVFRGMDVGQVTRADIERFLMKRTAEDRISGSTRNKNLNMLSRFFQKAIALNHARENPVAGIKRSQEPLKAVPFVSLAEQARLVGAMPERIQPLVALLLDTGLRLGEALRLEQRDLDFSRDVATVRISKNKTSRDVPFTSRGRRALSTALDAVDGDLPRVPALVFASLADRSITGEAVLKTCRRKQWTIGKRRAGLPDLRLHDLRHVWAVTCVRAGISLQELRELGGWKSLHMVLRYSRHVPANTPDLARTRLQAFISAGDSGHVRGHGSGA